MWSRHLATGLSALLILTGTAVIADHELGSTPPAIQLGSTALPPEVAAASSPISVPVTAPPAPAPSVPAASPVVDNSGTPAELIIPFASANHPNGVTARITADRLTPSGALFVPPDPRVLSWANQDAAPGSAKGTAIITGHINYLVDGTLVHGGLSDLAEYGKHNIGETFTIVLTDQRRLTYQLSAAVEYNKDQLSAQPELRKTIYNQDSDYGQPGQTRSGRLLLVSCGGAFDNATGNYEDNIFLYALPVN